MKFHALLVCLGLLLLVSLVAVPALAATVTCPSSCSCLLPAKAAELGYTEYCSGKQAVCGYDAKNEKYCYTNPVTTTTPVPVQVPQPCAKGCSCLAPDKAKGYTYCDGKQKVCDKDPAGNLLFCFEPEVTGAPVQVTCPASCTCTIPEKAEAAGLSLCGKTKTACDTTSAGITQYCYTLPATETTPTTTPVVRVATKSCTGTCSCLAPDKADAAGLTRCSGTSTPCGYDPLDRPMYCYTTERVTVESPVSATTTATPAAGTIGGPGEIPTGIPKREPERGESIFTVIGRFFSSLFFGRQQNEPVEDHFVTDFCRVQFGLTQCGDGCVNLSTDNDNCGSCGHWCQYSNAATEACCNGRCVDYNSDPSNCGRCGNACPEGFSCSDGYCYSPSAGCLSSRLTSCNGSCVNPLTDPLHCGECGNACPQGQYCAGGACRSCAPGEMYCAVHYPPGHSMTADEVSYRCTATASDRSNCGRCQHQCSSDGVCLDGVCTECPVEGKIGTLGDTLTVTTRCGNTCADLRSDEAFCGNCETSCAGGETCCSGQCTNLQGNLTHCGSCGHTCGSGYACIRGECIYGYPGFTCVAPKHACGRDCVDYSYDENNCGACGARCDTGETCCDGECIDTSSDPHHCGSCAGQCDLMDPYCVGGHCTHVCGSPAHFCAPEETCCDGQCIRMTEDNCGGCNIHCAADEVCCGDYYFLGSLETLTRYHAYCVTRHPGTCGECGDICNEEGGEGCCNGGCVDLTGSKWMCGGCDTECPDDPNVECCGGRCVDTLSGDDHCGSCDRQCPWNKECVNGRCCLRGTAIGCD